MKLRPRIYQIAAVNSIYKYFDTKHGNPVVVLPTGTGKSVVIAMFLESLYQRWSNQKVLVLTHSQELIKQNYDKMVSLWPGAPVGINSAALGMRDFRQPIIFGGIGSVAKNAGQFGKVSLVIIDEADLVSPKEQTMYRRFINELMLVNPKLKVVGLTATPFRLGYGLITEGEDALFTDICFDMSGVKAFNWLIEEGYLLPPIAQKMKLELDVEGVHMRGGEFITGELEAAINREDITREAIRQAVEIMSDRQHWLVFASGVQHALDVSDMLWEFDIPSVAIHGDLDKDARRDGLAAFKSGQYRAAVNNNILTTGFDMPHLDAIINLRPTGSSRLWVQILGRGTRPFYMPGYDLETKEGRLASIEASPKHDCLVADFARNSKRLGPINDPVIPRPKGKKGGPAPIKECPRCEAYNHTLAKFCIKCGYEFSFEVKFGTEASTDDLVKTEEPVVEEFAIDHITYQPHDKLGAPTSMKVSYYCGPQRFDEWVLFEHSGSRRKAETWWNSRCTSYPFPVSTKEALKLVDDVCKNPTHMRVWTNKKYPEILAFCYDGTAFNKQDAVFKDIGVDVRGRAYATETNFDLDDEIPF